MGPNLSVVGRRGFSLRPEQVRLRGGHRRRPQSSGPRPALARGVRRTAAQARTCSATAVGGRRVSRDPHPAGLGPIVGETPECAITGFVVSFGNPGSCRQVSLGSISLFWGRRAIAMSHTHADDREPDPSTDLAHLERTLRASIVLMQRSRREILRSRRRQKAIAAIERVEVQMRDTRAPSKAHTRPATT
jgi:hypothetical protein